MSLSFHQNNSNDTCPFSLLWSQPLADAQRTALSVCIIATVTHSIFWLQFIFYPTIRQKTMQWLYAYLLTDILLLTRFFFTFIVRTISYECTANFIWSLFVCYFEAAVDNYLNVLEVYILLALNLCRYVQITRNQNVYLTHVRLLAFAHVAIYLLPLINLIIQLNVGWAQLDRYDDGSCDIGYTNVYAQMVNTLIAFILPIILNILVICASIHHVRMTSQLRRAQHHVSAREKYHRSLVTQFLVFYTVWLLLWSPNVIVYQFTSGASTVTLIASLLNYIEIALDPFIIGALDVRFRHAWRQIWRFWKQKLPINFNRNQGQVGPDPINANLQPPHPMPNIDA